MIKLLEESLELKVRKDEVSLVKGLVKECEELFTKYHYVNCYSYRFEVYAVKNGGYKKFREKMFRTHKTPGNWLGQYS